MHSPLHVYYTMGLQQSNGSVDEKWVGENDGQFRYEETHRTCWKCEWVNLEELWVSNNAQLESENYWIANIDVETGLIVQYRKSEVLYLILGVQYWYNSWEYLLNPGIQQWIVLC